MKSSYLRNRWPISISDLSVLNPSIRNRSLDAHDHYILKNISFEINPGKIVAIVGPNGAGKTTFLKSLVGLIQPQTGTVLFDGKPFDAVKKSIAYVPQRMAVDWDFPVSVFDVVLMGRYAHIGWFKRPGSYDYNCAYAALNQVGLTAYKDLTIRLDENHSVTFTKTDKVAHTGSIDYSCFAYLGLPAGCMTQPVIEIGYSSN